MKYLASLPVVLPAALALAPAAHAQVLNPAQRSQPADSQPGPQAPVVVENRRVSNLREEDRVGSYQQPEWTTHRRFAETRVYVRPEGQTEFEYWLTTKLPQDGGPAENQAQYEFEFGLPNRFQLDIYLVSHQDGNEGALEIDEQKLEVRHALADWGEIWGNPTGYLEWSARNNAPDHVEAKLLLGEEIAEGWHWGLNLVYEQETGGARESGYEITGGLSKTLVDQRFSVGAEVKWAVVDTNVDRGDFSNEVLLGPSFQFRPTPRSHFDIAPLFGCTNESPEEKITFVFGWEF